MKSYCKALEIIWRPDHNLFQKIILWVFSWDAISSTCLTSLTTFPSEDSAPRAHPHLSSLVLPVAQLPVPQALSPRPHLSLHVLAHNQLLHCALSSGWNQGKASSSDMCVDVLQKCLVRVIFLDNADILKLMVCETVGFS